MLVVDCPRLAVAAMLHECLTLRLDVDTKTGAVGSEDRYRERASPHFRLRVRQLFYPGAPNANAGDMN